jgi:energy-coupling factor transport system permease protein
MNTQMRYAQQASFLGRLDFRTKLALLVAVTGVALLWENPLMGGALMTGVLVAWLVSGIPLHYLMSAALVVLPLYIIIVLTQGFLAGPIITSRTGLSAADFHIIFSFPEPWPLIGGSGISWEGLAYALNVIFKTSTMLMVVPLTVLTTNVNDMVVSLVKLGIPYKIVFVFSSTLRFFPILFDEANAIIEAQRLRGLAFEKMGPIRRVRVYARIAIPLILGAMARSQALEVVLQSKAFSGDPDRTYLHQVRLFGIDYLLMVGAGVFVLLAIAGYGLAGIGRFGMPDVLLLLGLD